MLIGVDWFYWFCAGSWLITQTGVKLLCSLLWLKYPSVFQAKADVSKTLDLWGFCKWYHNDYYFYHFHCPFTTEVLSQKKLACKIRYLQRNLKCICIMLTKEIFFFFGYAGSSLLLRLFSSCSEQGLASSFGAQASHCGGFCCCGAQAEAWGLL